MIAPWNSLTSENALPDSFGIALLQWAALAPADNFAVGAAAVLLLFVMLPRRLLVALPALVLAMLIATSAVAANEIDRR